MGLTNLRGKKKPLDRPNLLLLRPKLAVRSAPDVYLELYIIILFINVFINIYICYSNFSFPGMPSKKSSTH